MSEKKGGISVDTQHIFPVIKKWLYSEKEIFLREIVSNACDAVTKLRRLISLGDDSARDISDEGFKVDVVLDSEAKTITVTDNGIGMTSDEVEQYICRIALSGALDFIEKYEGEDSADNGIIGHFGLGFYSAFMVSSEVEVISRSYTGAPAVSWVCRDDGSYEMDECDSESAPARGTSVVMHINDEGEEYLNKQKLSDILRKYCAFMPVEIYLTDAGEKEDEKKENAPVNDTVPLWLKNPSDCTEEEYKEFYKKTFQDWREPLFWIHIKADYPLNFKGILFFPRITNEFDSLEGQVKLYYNQVFVADNIKEVIPEYLLMLKGVLDCPELPLNVSRSYLQNSGYVAKISSHISKKVADKLNSMFNLDREDYSKKWRDIKTFVEYACLRDRKFYDKVKSTILFERCTGDPVTLPEYLDGAKEKHENKLYYCSDKSAQASYISMFESEGIDVLVLDRIIDTQFAQLIEANEDGVKFCRVDSELADTMKAGEAAEIDGVREIFEKTVGEKTKIRFEALKDADIPAVLNVSEDSRRIDDMMKMYSAMGETAASPMPVEEELILNSASPLIASLKDKENSGEIAKHIYKLCQISRRQLTPGELKEFLADSYSLLSKL